MDFRGSEKPAGGLVIRTYSFGVETVPVALTGDLLVGSVHDGNVYKAMLARLRGEVEGKVAMVPERF